MLFDIAANGLTAVVAAPMGKVKDSCLRWWWRRKEEEDDENDAAEPI